MNISNGINFSGSNSDTLRLNAVPTAWYGRKYRCLVNNSNFSRTYILKFVCNWTGLLSTAWETAGNWSCGIIPDLNTDVMINTGMPYYPVVNVNTSCRSLLITNGASNVSVKTGAKLTLTGK